MQKLIKRTAQAQRQVARRMKLQAKRDRNEEKLTTRSTLLSSVREIRENVKDAQRARREDWEMGPLAPKRNLGFNDYGVVHEEARRDHDRVQAQINPHVVEQRCAWAGGPKLLCLAPGDRVVIMDGPEKGMIDVLKGVKRATGTVMLETRHKLLYKSRMDGQPQLVSMPLSVGSVRLVYPLRHPKTGVLRDVVINQLKAVPPNMKSDNMTLDRWEHGNKWDRLVPGLGVVIPWPEVQVPEPVATDADTLREQVEERTFFYGMLSPPMPPSVIDELRNRYSRFRTRHEAWYIQRKEAEEAAKKGRALKDIAFMRTPLDEFHELQKLRREARGEPQLSDDMLERIGRVMAQNKEAAAAAAAEPCSPPVVAPPPVNAAPPNVAAPP